MKSKKTTHTSQKASSSTTANRSLSPDSVVVWMTLAATWRSSLRSFLTDCVLAGSSGKTSLAHYLPGQIKRRQKIHKTETKLSRKVISPTSSPRLLRSGIAWPGGFLTLNTSESPSGAVASSLSDILETGDVPQRYFLSQRACAGILRRAEKRGRKLPERLERALRVVAEPPTA